MSTTYNTGDSGHPAVHTAVDGRLEALETALAGFSATLVDAADPTTWIPGSTFTLYYDATLGWPARPTRRADLTFVWDTDSASAPYPAINSTYALDGVDRVRHP